MTPLSPEMLAAIDEYLKWESPGREHPVVIWLRCLRSELTRVERENAAYERGEILLGILDNVSLEAANETIEVLIKEKDNLQIQLAQKDKAIHRLHMLCGRSMEYIETNGRDVQTCLYDDLKSEIAQIESNSTLGDK